LRKIRERKNAEQNNEKTLAAGFCAKGRNPADDKEKDSYL
jgi:hypothetical protein